jgi:hypothetical protein
MDEPIHLAQSHSCQVRIAIFDPFDEETNN